MSIVNVGFSLQNTFPDKPITIINSNKPGGAIDIMTRKMAMIAKKYDDITILVENVPGGSGAAAMGYVLNQPPDGYTLLATLKSFISTSLLNNTGPSIDDFHLVACMVYDWEALITNGKSDVSTFEDILRDNLSRQGQQKWLGPMTGGVDHLMALEIWDRCNISAKWVPYEGSSVSIASLLGGNGAVYVGNAVDTKGKPDLRIAAVAAPERLQDFPDVPTFKELGYDLTQQMWRGFSVKKGTPEPILNYLEELLYKISQDEEWKSFIRSGYADPIFLRHQDMAEKIEVDKALSRELLLSAGIISEDNKNDKELPDWYLALFTGALLVILLLVYKLKAWRIDSEFIIFLLLTSMPLFFLVKSFGFPDAGATGDYGPAFIPRTWSILMLFLIGLLFSRKLFTNTSIETALSGKMLFVKIIVLIIVYIVCIKIIGFYVSSFLFIITMLQVMVYKKLVHSILLSIGSLAVIFLIFNKLLGINLPSGFLF